VAERLVDLLDPQPGDSVLELAAGPGDTGFLAAQRIGSEGHLISTDLAPEMVAAAKRRAAELDLTNVSFEVADAQTLALPDTSFDGVLCRWGYMLLDQPARAFAETRRVLRPQGRLAFAVWAEAEANPWASAIGRALLARGLVERPEPDAPGPFRLANTELLRQLVVGARLEPLIEEDVALTWRYSDFDEFWATSRDLSRTLAATVQDADPRVTKTLAEDVRQALEPYQSDNGLAVPGVSRVVLARRPD
jgi:SAM-dependent methyltransferase